MERMAYVDDFSDGPLKTIGTLKISAATGPILPGVTGIAPVLVPLAAIEICVIQTGAVVVHTRRSEPKGLIGNVVFIAMTAFVAWG